MYILVCAHGNLINLKRSTSVRQQYLSMLNVFHPKIVGSSIMQSDEHFVKYHYYDPTI
jgi:hypothetical protein